MDQKKFILIETEDGTKSIRSLKYMETMHSTSGAYEESLLKHVFPSRILECEKPELNVLDVGCGIGYNILALLNEFEKLNSSSFLSITSLENDFSFVPLMNNISFNDSRDTLFGFIKTAMANGEYTGRNFKISIMSGDARRLIKQISDISFDAVFQDPFSPAKNPELWSVEFFKEISRVIEKNCILTTYSSAAHIRMALLEAGFNIGMGPSVGKKREGTLATIAGKIPFLSRDYINELYCNIKATPYRDPNLSDDRETILNGRILQIRSKSDRPIP